MATPISHAFDVLHVAKRLGTRNGGYEIVHESPGLEIGVYVLVARSRTASSPTSGTRSTWSSMAAES